MVEVATVDVALKFPNVGVDDATTTPLASVERMELNATFENVIVDVAVNVPTVASLMFAFTIYEFVVVALVVVEFVTLSPVMVARVEVKLSIIPVEACSSVAKKFVVVALVIVA